MTYEDIAANFPVEFALRDRDKLNYRYPKVNPSLRIRSRNYNFRYFIRPSLLLQLKSLKNRCWINIFFIQNLIFPGRRISIKQFKEQNWDSWDFFLSSFSKVLLKIVVPGTANDIFQGGRGGELRDCKFDFRNWNFFD